MRSRPAKLTASVAALIALGAAAYAAFSIEHDIARRREALRSFDLSARETTSAVADMRAAGQAYLAAGQSVDYWMPRVSALVADIAPKLDALRAVATTNEGRTALLDASSSLTEFSNVDRRARDYLGSGETLMAGDVVFTEGAETAAAAARLVESARLAEHQGFDVAEGGLRRRQAAILGGAALLNALVLLTLALAAPGPRIDSTGEAPSVDAPTAPTGELMLRQPVARARPSAAPGAEPATAGSGLASATRGSVPLLKAAAELCTDFNRITDSRELTGLLSRAADVMDANGVVVWLGDYAGADLKPVLAHGYPDEVLARMPAIPRAADNAAAAAYRSGKFQIVLKRPGISNGAVVAPLLAPEGCIGALAAEILAGSETSDGVQALAALFAAQLTGVLAGSVPAASRSPSNRIASA
jgi:hypothetical protein